jgi:hypothetical protein
MLFPRTGVTVKIINGVWTAPVNPGRYKIPNNTTIYVSRTGLDTNDCLSVATPCQTSLYVFRTFIKDFLDFTVAGNAVAMLQADNRGSITADAGFSVIGGGTLNLAFAFAQGQINLNSQTITFSGSVAFGQGTLAAQQLSYIGVGGVTWTNGGIVTGPKLACTGNSIIETDTGSQTVIPGSTTGKPGTGCQVF